METLREYRDDGPLAGWLGRTLAVDLGALALLALGIAPLALVLGIDRRAGPPTAAALVWFVLAASASAARSLTGRLDWLVPVALRAMEYGFLLAIGESAGGPAVPASYAAIFVASLHHYETVYRMRHRGAVPPRWVGWAAGGWEGRMIYAYVLARADVVAEGLYALAAAAGTLIVVESAVMWMRRPPEGAGGGAA